MSEPVTIPGPEEVLNRAAVLQLAAALEKAPPAGLRPVKLAVLATFTANMLRPYLVVEAARRGLALTWWAGPYGQVEQQVIDRGSGLYAEAPDVVLLLLRPADLSGQGGERWRSSCGICADKAARRCS
jgi:predicted enzyme involved in methoxymalonyl-ACP biosynthesis